MDELRAALELATEDELSDLTEILFRRKFNPLDYLQGPDPVEIHSQTYFNRLDALEQRFRFLAADGITVLKGKTEQVTYRQVLIRICRHLKLPYSAALSTTDLEAEIFLNLLHRAWQQLPASQQQVFMGEMQQSLQETNLSPAVVTSLQDPLRLLLEGGSALAVSSLLRPMLLQQLARQFAAHFAAHQAAMTTLLQGSKAALGVQGQLALQGARRGMAISAARYGVARGMFVVLGSTLWVWFFADLGWRAIATNYGRIIPTVFALAQIRLAHAESWNPV
jgi:uncharacterized protein YaaW (UPF0174 family)